VQEEDWCRVAGADVLVTDGDAARGGDPSHDVILAAVG
jgi:hypothetical protein